MGVDGDFGSRGIGVEMGGVVEGVPYWEEDRLAVLFLRLTVSQMEVKTLGGRLVIEKSQR